ncbi:MAG: 50S ribosomal protein L21 [Clostridiaceae bacterium]|jgi:large subunit ribosomal protein L21|nr:50S ribosomal protein L21 [Bacillota bacterium]NLN51699.1 50S ribosomal protein L21 [Clostridiaceae bacterium]
MYAIIKTGGKQYKVAEGDEIYIEKLEGEAGDEIVFDQVLALSKDDDLQVGSPIVEDASVKAEIVKHGKGKKITIFKYKAKKGYRRRQGHRQPYTCVKITQIA